MTKQTFINALCGAAFCVLMPAAVALAQPGSGGPDPGADPPATGVPLDGGVSLLLAAGGAYVLKRLRARRAKA